MLAWEQKTIQHIPLRGLISMRIFIVSNTCYDNRELDYKVDSFDGNRIEVESQYDRSSLHPRITLLLARSQSIFFSCQMDNNGSDDG